MSSVAHPRDTATPLLDYAVDDDDRHLKSYTAGEDDSRLANMAKELGLQRQRQPRNQVRRYNRVRQQSDQHNINSRTFLEVSRKWIRDPIAEDARMRSIYTSHKRIDENDLLAERTLLERLQTSWDNQELDDNKTYYHPLEEENVLQDEEELEHDGDIEQRGSNLASAVLGIIKGMVGPAILYLPHGFAGAGYAVALPILFICTAMYLHSSRCLLDAWNHEVTRDTDTTNGSSAARGELTSMLQSYHRKERVILSYPELAYRAFGPSGETMVKTGIALMQSGVCLTYLIFVPHNLQASMQTLSGMNIQPDIWLILMILIELPLSWIRDIRKLTPTNFLANTLIMYGLLLCLGFAFAQASSSTAGMKPLESIWDHLKGLDAFHGQWFLFIGTSVLLFEGSITLLVPLQEAVHSDEDRKAFPKVYQRVILGIVGFYGFFGITCWMAFGPQVNIVLTTSLPQQSVLGTSVQLAYSLAVILTFPLQNFPALEISCNCIGTLLFGQHTSTMTRNIISSILVVCLALVGVMAMDNLDKIVSLMGGLLGCPIAFVVPPLIHSSLCHNEMTECRKWGNRIVMFGGVLSMAVATVATLSRW